MVIKNSPGHAARAVKAGRAEAIPLHSIDLDASLCIEEGPEQDAAQRTAVFHRGAQIRNERLQHGVDAEYITWLTVGNQPTDTTTLIPFLKSMEENLNLVCYNQ